MTEQELKPKEKEEAPLKGERVRPGRVFIPAVDIYETPEALVLVADMPGVSSDNVTLDLKENLLTIYGQVRPVSGERNPLGPGIRHRRLLPGVPGGGTGRHGQNRGQR
jgi:HSP20 family molecular chaperone IbpA